MKLSQDSVQLLPSALTCQTCREVASIRFFQDYPHFRFLCACGHNNFDGSGGQHHSGEAGAVLESEKPLKTSIDEEGSKPTIDWTCKTCHQLASFKSFRSHPPLRFICACGDNNFDGSGGQHHSGEGSAALESERKLKTSIDEGGSQPTVDWTCKTCHQLASFKSFQSHPTLRLICACGDNNFDGSGGQHHSGEGGAILESEKPLKTSIDEIGNRQPEIRGSSTSSITQISTSETGGGPGEGRQGGQGDGFKRNRQPKIQGPGTSSTAQIPDSEAGGGPGQDWQGVDVIREGFACPKCKDPVLHQAHRFEILKRELDRDREGAKGGQGDEKVNRQPETQGSGTSSTTQISDSETGGRPGEGEQRGQVMRKEIVGQKFQDPVVHQPHERYCTLARQLDQVREGGKGGQADEKGNRQPETQGFGTSIPAELSDSEIGGGPEESEEGGQVMRKDIASQQFRDLVLHQSIRFEILKRELDQDREGGKGGQGDEKGDRQPQTQGSGTSSTTQILDSGTGGGSEEGGQHGQVMRKDIAGQQFKDPVLHQAKRFQILKRELDQDRGGGKGGQGDEKGNRQPQTQGSGTSSTTQTLDSGTGGGPEEGGQRGQVMRKDIAGQQIKDPVLHRFQILKRQLDQGRAGRQGDEKGNRQSETQGSGTSSTTQILDSGTGGGPGEGGQGGQVIREDIAGQKLKDPVLHQPMDLQRELDHRIRRYLQSLPEVREGGQGGQGDEKGNRLSETQGSGNSRTTQISDSGTGDGPGEGGQGGQGDEKGNRLSETQRSGNSRTTQISDSGTGDGPGKGGQGGQGDEKGNRLSETQGSGNSQTTQISDSGTGDGPGEGGQGGQGLPGDDVASPVDFPWQI